MTVNNDALEAVVDAVLAGRDPPAGTDPALMERVRSLHQALQSVRMDATFRSRLLAKLTAKKEAMPFSLLDWIRAFAWQASALAFLLIAIWSAPLHDVLQYRTDSAGSQPTGVSLQEPMRVLGGKGKEPTDLGREKSDAAPSPTPSALNGVEVQQEGWNEEIPEGASPLKSQNRNIEAPLPAPATDRSRGEAKPLAPAFNESFTSGAPLPGVAQRHMPDTVNLLLILLGTATVALFFVRKR